MQTFWCIPFTSRPASSAIFAIKLFLSWKISQRLSYLFYSFSSWLFCLVKRFTFQEQAALFSFSGCGSFLAWLFLLLYEFLVQQLVLLYLSVVAAFFEIYPFPSKLGKPFYFPSTLPCILLARLCLKFLSFPKNKNEN